MRKATIDQINNFGQTPTQLLEDAPHPPRNLPEIAPLPPHIFYTPKQLQVTLQFFLFVLTFLAACICFVHLFFVFFSIFWLFVDVFQLQAFFVNISNCPICYLSVPCVSPGASNSWYLGVNTDRIITVDYHRVWSSLFYFRALAPAFFPLLFCCSFSHFLSLFSLALLNFGLFFRLLHPTDGLRTILPPQGQCHPMPLPSPLRSIPLSQPKSKCRPA